MKIFVTGATGYIGSHLVKQLVESGHRVVAYCRSAAKAEHIRMDQVEIAIGDLDDRQGLMEAIQGCEAVFHVAAFARVWAKDSGTFYRINVEGTRNVLEAAKNSSVSRVVFTSTGGVFGASFDQPVTESHIRKKDFFNEYEGSKCLAESWVKDYVIAGLDIVIVSPTRVYGPYLFGTPESVTRMISSYVKGAWRWIPGPAEKIGNYVFIDDVVAGHIRALEKGKSGETYILGGTNHTYTEFFHILKQVSGLNKLMIPLPIWVINLIAYMNLLGARIFSIEPALTPKWVAKARYHWEVDVSKMREQLGVRGVPLEEGLRRTVSWLRS